MLQKTNNEPTIGREEHSNYQSHPGVPYTREHLVEELNKDSHEGNGALENKIIMAACPDLTSNWIHYDRTMTMHDLHVVYIGPVMNNYGLQQMSNPHIYIVWGAELR